MPRGKGRQRKRAVEEISSMPMPECTKPSGAMTSQLQETNPSIEGVKLLPERKARLSERQAKLAAVEVRRSGRLRNEVKPTQNKDSKLVGEIIITTDSEVDEKDKAADSISGAMENQHQEKEPLHQGVEVQMQSKRKASLLVRKGKRAAIEVQQSAQFQNEIRSTQREAIRRVIEEMTLSEKDNEDNVPESTAVPKNMEEGVEIHQQEVEAGTIVKLKPNEANKVEAGSTSFAVNLNYKTMYFESQQKIELLRLENQKLAMKLENAHEAEANYLRHIKTILDLNSQNVAERIEELWREKQRPLE